MLGAAFILHDWIGHFLTYKIMIDQNLIILNGWRLYLQKFC